jgi:hypothetical protein
VKLYVPAVVGVPKKAPGLLEADAPLGGEVKKQYVPVHSMALVGEKAKPKPGGNSPEMIFHLKF